MSGDWHWVAPALAVGAKIAPAHIPALARDHGISAVVDLRDEDCDDEAALAAAGIAFLHLPTPDMHPPAARDLDRGVAFVRGEIGQGGRVLVHCEHGIGRSATLALCALVDAGGDPLAALRACKEAREKISPSLSQYEGWKAWLATRGLGPPDFDAFGRIAYRHLAKA